MPLRFNMLLREEGIDPATVRLLRHETKRYKGQTPYSLWREAPHDPVRLERYQSTQKRTRRNWFLSDHWASFVVTPDGLTLFVGMYRVGAITPVPPGHVHDLSGDPLDPSLNDLFALARMNSFDRYAGRLVVDWSGNTRAWVQLASNQDKEIVELAREAIDPPFPGFTSFVKPLSEIEAQPPSWLEALASVTGVYLLTCPKTGDQYVGSASGTGGFLARWRCYMDGRDGGNVGLKGRETDFIVSILQVIGASDNPPADSTILKHESIWIRKLQSRVIGLNRNG